MVSIIMMMVMIKMMMVVLVLSRMNLKDVWVGQDNVDSGLVASHILQLSHVRPDQHHQDHDEDDDDHDAVNDQHVESVDHDEKLLAS